MKHYQNFDILIGRPEKDHYPVRITDSPAGRKTDGILQELPQEKRSVQDLLAYTRELVAERQDVKELGQELYDFLLPERIRGIFRESLGEGNIRIRISWDTDQDAFGRLPWECLYDGEQFILHDERISLVRLPHNTGVVKTLDRPKSVRLLIVTASPSDMSPLNTNEEVKQICDILSLTPEIEIEVLLEAKADSFRDTLQTFQPHILHVAAHGGSTESGEGTLILNDEHGKADEITAEDLTILLQTAPTRMVFLNACHTADGALLGITPHLIRAGIPAVIGMQYAIPDWFAIQFVTTLYSKLAEYGNIEQALTVARQIGYAGDKDKGNWLIPALFMNSTNGRLWLPDPIENLIGKEEKFYYDPVGNDIEKFLEEYLGTAEHPTPFGGRDEELATLNQWLDDPEKPNIGLMVAGAGGGKSALLVQWSKELAKQRDDIDTIFFPISIRFNTSRQSQFFSYINRRLAKIYGETANMDAIRDPELQRAQFQDFLQKTPPNGKRLLLIVDGMDEAIWEANHLLFPSKLGENVQVFTSARYQSGDVDGQGWLKRMGWQRSNTAELFMLQPLDKEELAGVLESMGNPLDQLATDVDVLSELYRLTDGDPLLVRLYVESLHEQAEECQNQFIMS